MRVLSRSSGLLVVCALWLLAGLAAASEVLTADPTFASRVYGLGPTPFTPVGNEPYMIFDMPGNIGVNFMRPFSKRELYNARTELALASGSPNFVVGAHGSYGEINGATPDVEDRLVRSFLRSGRNGCVFAVCYAGSGLPDEQEPVAQRFSRRFRPGQLAYAARQIFRADIRGDGALVLDVTNRMGDRADFGKQFLRFDHTGESEFLTNPSEMFPQFETIILVSSDGVRRFVRGAMVDFDAIAVGRDDLRDHVPGIPDGDTLSGRGRRARRGLGSMSHLGTHDFDDPPSPTTRTRRRRR